jgi:hypothetical protein
MSYFRSVAAGVKKNRKYIPEELCHTVAAEQKQGCFPQSLRCRFHDVFHLPEQRRKESPSYS